MTQQELELVSYIKERVKFEGNKCLPQECYYFNKYPDDSWAYCELFEGMNLKNYSRCEDCKKYFN